MLIELGVIISITAVLLYVWLTWNYNYWKKLGIPYLEPQLFFGNIKEVVLMTQNKGLVYDDLYWKSEEPVLGLFAMRQPQWLIRDAALFKTICVNEFNCFQDNDLYVEPSDFFHSTHAFFLTGDRWKATRNKVSPSLTLGKLKMYFPHAITACRAMIDYLNENIDKEHDVQHFTCLYSTDMVMSCVYGLKSESFKDPEMKYKTAISNIINPGFWHFAKFTFASLFPSVGHFFQVGVTMKKTVDFYTGVVREAVNYRKVNDVRRDDFLQYIMDSSGKNGNPEYSTWDITGFTMNLVTDASETVALVVTLIMDVILRYPEEKNKVVEEIDRNINTIEDITYENINKLSYLNAFIKEALRIRATLPLIERVCTKDCEIFHGGKTYNFKKGDKIAASIYSFHMDSKYFPDPEEFRPERFLEKDDYLGYWPFGLGPRTCLGKLLGQMEIKVFLCGFLKYFEVLPAKEITPKIEYDPNSIIGLAIKNGVQIKIKKR